MIVKLTEEHIQILSFALGLYADKVYEQNMIIPTDMEKSAKDINDIRDAFSFATEE